MTVGRLIVETEYIAKGKIIRSKIDHEYKWTNEGRRR